MIAHRISDLPRAASRQNTRSRTRATRATVAPQRRLRATRMGLVARLVRLGAAVHQRFEDHTWMRDPEGNDFCVTDMSTPAELRRVMKSRSPAETPDRGRG
jgi:hypothetical protein